MHPSVAALSHVPYRLAFAPLPLRLHVGLLLSKRHAQHVVAGRAGPHHAQALVKTINIVLVALRMDAVISSLSMGPPLEHQLNSASACSSICVVDTQLHACVTNTSVVHVGRVCLLRIM